jgi:hypothetical protein
MVSEEIRGMIPDYVRGLLSPEEAQAVANALSSIPELAKELDAAKRYYTVLNQLPEPEVPADFLNRINRRIDHKPWTQKALDLLFKPFFPKIPLEFAGLAACLVAVVIILKPEFGLHQKTELPLAINTSTYINDESPQPAIAQDKKKVQAPAPRLSAAKKVDRVTPPVASRQIEPQKAPASAIVVENKVADDNLAVNAAAGTTSQPAQEYLASTAPLQEKEDLPALKESEEKPASFAAVDIGAIELVYTSTPPKDNKLRAAKSAQASMSRMETSPEQVTLAQSDVSLEKEKTAAAGEPIRSSLPDQGASPVSVSEILDSILVKYDSLFSVKSIHGMISYTLTLSPDRLSALSKELQQSFSITSRLLPFDPLVAKLVKVSLTVKEQ